MGDPQGSRVWGERSQSSTVCVPTGSFTAAWLRSIAVSPIAWAAAVALAFLFPAASILTARGTLVLRDVHAAQAQIDLTWLGSVAGLLASLFWIPRAAGFRDALGRGREWAESAHLFLAAGALGAGLAQVLSLASPGAFSLARFADHAGVVLHMSGIAMLASSIPFSRRAPAWAVLAVIGCAEAFPASAFGRAVGVSSTMDASQMGTWLIVGGLWIASAPSPRLLVGHT